MKEIAYEGSPFEEEESRFQKLKKRSLGSAKVPIVRTLAGDTAEFTQGGGISHAQAVIAEAVHRDEVRETKRALPVYAEESTHHLWRFILILFLGFTFMLAVGIYVLIGTKTPPQMTMEEQSQKATPLVRDNEPLSIVITGASREKILADITSALGNSTLPQGEILPINFLVAQGDRTQSATTEEFLNALALLPPPPSLIRSLAPEFSYSKYGGTVIIDTLILTSRMPSNTFASMLEWEPRMAETLASLVNPSVSRRDIRDFANREFRDERIGVIDARILIDPVGNVLLVYGFQNDHTLIITGDREGLLLAQTGAEATK